MVAIWHAKSSSDQGSDSGSMQWKSVHWTTGKSQSPFYFIYYLFFSITIFKHSAGTYIHNIQSLPLSTSSTLKHIFIYLLIGCTSSQLQHVESLGCGIWDLALNQAWTQAPLHGPTEYQPLGPLRKSLQNSFTFEKWNLYPLSNSPYFLLISLFNSYSVPFSVSLILCVWLFQVVMSESDSICLFCDWLLHSCHRVPVAQSHVVANARIPFFSLNMVHCMCMPH